MVDVWTDLSPFGAFNRLFQALEGGVAPQPGLPVNIHATETGWTILAPVPGLPAEGLTLTVEPDRRLTLTVNKEDKAPEGYTPIRRERGAWKASRSFSLPREADADHVTASLKNGLLTVSIPRRAEAGRRTIPVVSA